MGATAGKSVFVCVNRNVCGNVRRGGQGIEKKKERRKAFSTVHLFTDFPECSSRDATYGILGAALVGLGLPSSGTRKSQSYGFGESSSGSWFTMHLVLSLAF